MAISKSRSRFLLRESGEGMGIRFRIGWIALRKHMSSLSRQPVVRMRELWTEGSRDLETVSLISILNFVFSDSTAKTT